MKDPQCISIKKRANRLEELKSNLQSTDVGDLCKLTVVLDSYLITMRLPIKEQTDLGRYSTDQQNSLPLGVPRTSKVSSGF